MSSIAIFNSAMNLYVTLAALALFAVAVVYSNIGTKFEKFTVFLFVGFLLELIATWLGSNILEYSRQGMYVNFLVFIELSIFLASMVLLAISASQMVSNSIPDTPVILGMTGLGLISIVYFVIIAPDGNMANSMRQIFPMAGIAYISASLWSQNGKKLAGFKLAAITTSVVTGVLLFKMLGVQYVMLHTWYVSAMTYTALAISLVVMKVDVLYGLLSAREQEIERYNKRIEEIIKLSPFPIIISRLSDDRLILANNNAIKLFGIEPKELDRYHLRDFFADMDNRRMLNERLEQEREVHDFEILVKTPTGLSPFWLLTSANIIDYNYDIALYAAFQDITSRKTRENLLKNQALRDPLTSLFNRRYFEEEVNKRIKAAKENNDPYCIFMLDADHFKKINDGYGHKIGDKVLIELAATGERALREVDIIARYGGEEFVVFLDKATPEKALSVAERLRETISGLSVYSDDGKPVKFTVSIGISSSEVSDDVDTLIKTADDALYRAKENGRNRSEIFTARDLKNFRGENKKNVSEITQMHPVFAKEDSEEISLLDGIGANQIQDAQIKIEENQVCACTPIVDTEKQ